MNSVVIVADSSFVVETIRMALKNTARLKLLGKVDGRGSIRRPIDQSQPDIVLVDEMQNSEHALERIRECREEAPAATILLLTMRMDDDWVGQCARRRCRRVHLEVRAPAEPRHADSRDREPQHRLRPAAGGGRGSPAALRRTRT